MLHSQIVQDFSEFVERHRFLCRRAGCGPAGFRSNLVPLSSLPSPTTILRTVAAQTVKKEQLIIS